MNKKIIIIVALVVVLFAGIVFLNNAKNNQKLSEGNPYDKETLKQSTIDLLGNKLYEDIIVPDVLDKRLLNKETFSVYYFSPECPACKKTTPVVVPLTEEYKIEMVKMNLLEYDKKDYYNISGTPTIVHYKEGVEVGRISGAAEEEDFREFFEEVVLKK